MSTLNVPKKLEEALESVALRTKKSASYHMKKAIQQYLEDEADRQAVLEAIRNDDGTRIPLEEIRERVKQKLSNVENRL